jgi:hypothetical protein
MIGVFNRGKAGHVAGLLRPPAVRRPEFIITRPLNGKRHADRSATPACRRIVQQNVPSNLLRGVEGPSIRKHTLRISI